MFGDALTLGFLIIQLWITLEASKVLEEDGRRTTGFDVQLGWKERFAQKAVFKLIF